MQVKRVPCPPAVALIGKITPAAMLDVLRALDDHSAGRWEVSAVGVNRTDGPYFVVDYWPINRPGRWRMAFGFDGSLWMD